jgi:hypothetical protein
VSKDVIPVHQWTNGGAEVLVVRYVDEKHQSYGSFQHPAKVGETVIAPDWNAEPKCGGGIHGWPWGLSLGDGKECDWSAVWQVYGAKPEDVVLIDGKVKFRTGVLRFVGDWHAAMMFVLSGQMAWVHQAARGAASATGASGAASATGERGAASATGARGAASATGASGAASATGASGAASATGWRGAASATGWRGAASATGWSGAASATGESGAASATGARGAASATGARGAASATGASGAASATGERGAASATGARGAASATGWSGAASATGARGAASATGASGAASATGECSAAVVTGDCGRARAGEHGCIALAFYNSKHARYEMRCALVGKGRGKLKPNTWYQLNGKGEFVEVKG